MSYAVQKDSSRRLAGLAVVVTLHAALIYALVYGLARKIVEVVRQPLETKIIEEVKAPPPDRPPPPPPPKLTTPPPPYIPPPEVQVHVPETFVPGGGAASERSRDRALEFPDRGRRQSAGQQGRALIRLPPPRRGRKGRPEPVQIQTGHGRREAGAGAGAHRLRVEARVTRRGPGGTSRGFLEFQIVVSGSAGYETKIVGCSEPVGGRAGRRLDRRGNRRFERGDGAGFQSGDCSLLCHRGQTGSVRG